MTPPPNQRWRERRDSYRPPGEPINTLRYEVAEIAGEGSDTTARTFIERHHYSGAYVAARRRFGLYRAAQLVGVAVFSVPARNEVLTKVLPCEPLAALDLGRFVLLDDVPGNGETWFLGRAFELLRREGFFGVVSFADPYPRSRLDGTQVFPGHIGTIYQAHNAVYTGRGAPATLRLLPDGRVYSNVTQGKVRRRETGWQYGVEQLVAAGAERPRPGEDLRAWQNHWRPLVTRPMRHRGNHRYVWALARRDRRHLPESLPYPKQDGFRRAA